MRTSSAGCMVEGLPPIGAMTARERLKAAEITGVAEGRQA